MSNFIAEKITLSHHYCGNQATGWKARLYYRSRRGIPGSMDGEICTVYTEQDAYTSCLFVLNQAIAWDINLIPLLQANSKSIHLDIDASDAEWDGQWQKLASELKVKLAKFAKDKAATQKQNPNPEYPPGLPPELVAWLKAKGLHIAGVAINPKPNIPPPPGDPANN